MSSTTCRRCRRLPLVAAGAIALTLAAPGAALGHGRSAERRAAEIRALGYEHALQHMAAEKAPKARSLSRKRRGAIRRARAAAVPAQDGVWRAPFSIPSVAIHAIVMRSGKVLYYDTTGKGTNEGDAYVLDPVRRTTQRVLPPPVDGRVPNIWCGGQSVLPDGRVLLTGGTLAYGPYRGLKAVFTFDPVSESWTRHADMQHGRWYPSQVALPDGRVAIMSGLDEIGANNQDIEVFDPATNKTTVVGHRGGTGEAPRGGLYPHLFQMKSGRAMVAGPNVGDDTWSFRMTGSAFSWQNLPNIAQTRKLASGVLLPGDATGSSKAMLVGGGSKAVGVTKTSEVFDEANPGWKAGPTMNTARGHHNTVMLPDGSMVTLGGGSSADDASLYAAGAEHLNVELYDPATQTWRVGPPQVERRAYHSVGLLLPDATVLSSGDDGGQPDSDTVEIYEPAYLHKGVARPTITRAPEAVGYNATFAVSTPDAIDRAVLVAPGATTHGADMQQRVVNVATTRRADGTGVDIVAPRDGNAAPPGYYMLFLLNREGVPSVAKFVRVGSDVTTPPAGDTEAPTAPSGLTATAAGPLRVDLSWTASSDNFGVTAYDVYRDGAKIASTNGATSYSDTTADAATTHTYTVRARDAASNASAASNAVTVTTPAAVNALRNPGFEEDADANGRPDIWWASTTTAPFTRSGQEPLTGTYSGRHQPAGDVSYVIGQTVKSLTGGRQYRVGANVHIPLTTDVFTFRVQVRWRRADGTTIRDDTVRTYKTPGRWDHSSTTLTSPAETASADVRMEATSLNATVYVDDFTFLR